MSLERAQLVVPVRLKLIEPGPECGHRLRSKPEDANPRVLGRTFVGHHAGLQEDTQVLARRSRRQARLFGEFTSEPRPGAQKLHDREPGGIGKGMEQRSQRPSAIHHHADNNFSIQQLLSRPSACSHSTASHRHKISLGLLTRFWLYKIVTPSPVTSRNGKCRKFFQPDVPNPDLQMSATACCGQANSSSKGL
jgi:hypothetical protein